ncbi:MAG: DUF1285 domain-containing protein [Hyphomicrobiaceae bacterium]
MTQEPLKPAAAMQPAALEAIVRSVGGETTRNREAAPVHLWNPPYCGDIGLEIKADGIWHYRGSPITRRPLVELFASVLRKDDDGKTYLVTPAEKVDVQVADAPFLAVEMQVTGDGEARSVALRTNLDTWVTIKAAHPIRFEVQEPAGGLKPYVLVRGRLEALLVRAVYLDLVALATEGDGNQPGFWSGGLWWPLMA